MSEEQKIHLLPKDVTNWFRGIAVVMVVLSHYAEWWVWFVPLEEAAKPFHSALTKLGVYGVDIFFLLSGYAAVKSMGQETMSFSFIWKRIKNIYIPYFVVVGIIELLSGGFTSLHDFWLFASGYDYWYMFVLFVMYLGFIGIYTVVGGSGPRATVFALFTGVFSYILYDRGMQDFWYVSNIAFAIGVIAGEYEGQVAKLVNKAGFPVLGLLAAALLPAVWSGYMGYVEKAGFTPEQVLWLQIGATVIWTLFILFLAAKCRMKEWLLSFLGKNSLYIYLTHTYVFMRCVNNLEINTLLCFIVSAALTVAISALLHLGMKYLLGNGAINFLFWAYILILLRITVFRSGLSLEGLFRNGSINLTLFQEYLPMLGERKWFRFLYLFAGNIIWFVPFGAYLLWAGKVKRVGVATLCGLLFSLMIETLQYVFGTGVSELDDLILNTIGAWAGAFCYAKYGTSLKCNNNHGKIKI